MFNRLTEDGFIIQNVTARLSHTNREEKYITSHYINENVNNTS